MRLFLSFIFISKLILLTACSNESNQIYEKSTKKSFAEVIQDSEFAITENNFRITNRLHIGDAIQKRGNTDFPKNEVILFCNLTIAEEMLKIEPRYINYCPYKVTATEYKKKIIIGTRLLPVNTGNKQMDLIAKNINKKLRSMVEYAASEDPFILEYN
ncbi:MAG: DUF302 domain-containing protein [Proteobacteria bacterium]|nr:DUF302 domain-containing protein [Pseudomonadota bacterium]NOG60837.1 DUF302 domain-containing protein [Pseudomonadota bacterium]